MAEVSRKIKYKLVVYLFFIVGIGVICGAGILSTMREMPDINAGSISFLLGLLVLELILLKNFCVLLYAIKSKSYVSAIVQEIKQETCFGDEAGSYYNAYRVFVRYTYKGKEFKNVFWYALDDEKTRVGRLPIKGQQYKLLINPKKPTKILSGKLGKKDL